MKILYAIHVKFSLAFFMLLIIQQAVGSTNRFFVADNPPEENVVNLYLDCDSCNMHDIRENLDIVNYVHDPALANVYVMVTTIPASGGTVYTMEFTGLKNFSGMADTLRFPIDAQVSAYEKQDIMLTKLKRGLLPYILKTPDADRLTIHFRRKTGHVVEDINDPWDSCVYSLTAMGSASMEKNYESVFLYVNGYFGRITKASKTELNFKFSDTESTSTYEVYEGESMDYRYFMQTYSLGMLHVRSIGDHFGAGLIGDVQNSSYANLEFQLNLLPTVEYSIFNYKSSSRKQLRFLYSLGYEHSDYYETTIFDRSADYLFKQELRIGFSLKKPFGDFSAQFKAKNYLIHGSGIDMSFYAGSGFNVYKGLWLNANFAVSIPQNQRSLSAGSSSLESALTGQQQQETGMSVQIGFGFTFRFGSKSNNAVNPRFEF